MRPVGRGVFFTLGSTHVRSRRRRGVDSLIRCLRGGPTTGVYVANCTSMGANGTAVGFGLSRTHTGGITRTLGSGNVTTSEVGISFGKSAMRPCSAPGRGHMDVYVAR